MTRETEPDRPSLVIAAKQGIQVLGMQGHFTQELPEIHVLEETAACGEDLKRILAERRPNVGVVDTHLPMSAGEPFLTFLERMHREFPDTGIVVTDEAPTNSGVRLLYRLIGALGYYEKQCPPAELIKTIRCAVEGTLAPDPMRLSPLIERRLRRNGVTTISGLLSPRQGDIFRRLGRGESPRDIGREHGIGVSTVVTHIERIKSNLGIGLSELRYAAALEQTGTPWLAELDEPETMPDSLCT